MSEPDYSSLRAAMVASQLRPNAVNDPVVVAAMAAVPRERFAAGVTGGLAYLDTPVPLAGGRFLNTPLATGRLLTEARPRPGERALVVGAGGGYGAAVLARIGLQVVALEDGSLPPIPAIDGVTAVTGPLAEGWAEAAPYDLILVDGVVAEVPKAIVGQLKDGGRLAAGIVDGGVPRLAIGRRAGDGFGMTSVVDVDAAPLPGFARPKAFSF